MKGVFYLALVTLIDLPRSPINYSNEAKKFDELRLKDTPLSTSGSVTFTSLSSGITYQATTGGEAQLLSILQGVIDPSLVTADKWNSISSAINEGVLQCKTDILETRALLEKQIGANIFVNKTGYGGYTLFDSLSDDAINFGTTTATINTTAKTCTWDSTGTKLLAFNPVTFNNNFSSIMCKIDGNYQAGVVQSSVTNSNSISVASPNYTLTTADKLYAYSVASAKKKEIGISNVTGGSTTYDRTTPVQVVNQNYATLTNARPKFMSNGWIINAVYATNTIKIYVSLDNGATFIDTTINVGTLSTNIVFSIDVVGNSIYIALINASNTGLGFMRFDKNLDTGTSWSQFVSTIAITSQTSFDSVSIKMLNANIGTVVASSRNSTYPNSYNIVSAKTSDGGNTWTKQNGTVGFDQVTINDTVGLNHTNCSVIYDSLNYPCIVNALNSGTSLNRIFFRRWNGSSWSEINMFILDGFTQINPQISIKKYLPNINRLVVKWQGRDATDTIVDNQRVAYSDDNGATWIVVGKITSGNTISRISGNLCEDNTGKLYAVYDDNGTIKYQTSTDGGATWGNLTTIGTEIGQPTTCDNYYQFQNPITLYRDSLGVKFYGKFTVGGAYNLTLSENVTQLANDSLPITTQYTVKQGSTVFNFDSNINGSSLQYKLTGLSTPTVNLSILGKSTTSTAVAYAVG